MPPAFDKATEHLAKVVAAYPIKADKEKFRIFLFGPYLKPDEEVPEPGAGASSLVHAKFLRFLVAKDLRKAGWIVDFGESEEILAIWKTANSAIDIGKMEYDHASAACGAIVILPSSPGSFCEMGLFASSEKISKKTLSLVHAKHKNDESFFRNGLVQVFRSQGGTCEYELYEDKNAVLKAVHEFVKIKFNYYIWRDEAIATGERRKREKDAE